MSIVITGASGHLGRRVAELVLDRDPSAAPILVTRSPGRLADLAARGADVRHGDFDDPASLDAAFAGGTRLLLVSTDVPGDRPRQHRAAIDAAVRAGVGHLVYTSILRPEPDHPGLVPAEHRATEDAIRASGAAWTFLRNSIYAEIQAGAAQAALATGQHVTNTGDGRTAFVAREDCAAVAAAVLTGDGHEGQAYDVTGPDLLAAGDLATLFGELGGRAVEVVQVDDAAYAEGLAAATGMPLEAATVFAAFGTATRDGYLDARTDVVERLTGRPPLALRTVLESVL